MSASLLSLSLSVLGNAPQKALKKLHPSAPKQSEFLARILRRGHFVRQSFVIPFRTFDLIFPRVFFTRSDVSRAAGAFAQHS